MWLAGRSRAFWIATVVLPLLYLVSFGPACWISSRTDSGVWLLEVAYQPVLQCVWHAPGSVQKILFGYGRLLASPGWDFSSGSSENWAPWSHPRVIWPRHVGWYARASKRWGSVDQSLKSAGMAASVIAAAAVAGTILWCLIKASGIDERKKRGWASWLMLLVLVAALYVEGFGPAYRLGRAGWIAPQLVEDFYAPLWWVTQYSGSARNAMFWYLGVWGALVG